MRKWIFVGLIAGCAQFAIVTLIAFSGTEAPAPDPRAKPAPPARRKAESSGVRAGVGVGSPVAGLNQSPPAIPAPVPVERPPAPAALQEAQAAPAPVSRPSLPVALPPAPAPLPAARPTATSAAPAPAPPAASVPTAASVPPAASPPAPAVPPAPDLSLKPVEDVIREIFGAHGEKAVEVARCESELATSAKNGNALGLFQLGVNERREYGHGEDALTQIKAAYELFLTRGWQPWVCG